MTITANPTKTVEWFTNDHTGAIPIGIFLDSTLNSLPYTDRRALWGGNLDAPDHLPSGSTLPCSDASLVMSSATILRWL